MNYWQNRGIERLAIVCWLPPHSMPGTPPVLGKADYARNGSPIVRPYWGKAQRPFDQDPDAWQPVNTQERMFSS